MAKYLIYLFLIMIIFLVSSSSAQPIDVEYFYQIGCPDCKVTAPIIDLIESEYENVNITRTDVMVAEGLDRWKVYGFREVPAVVVNNETLIPKEEITEENMRAVIVNYRENRQMASFIKDETLNIPIAYSLGLFAGMSPCIMAILGFLLSLTAGTSSSVRNGMARAGIFGFGLVSSYIAFGLLLFAFKTSVPDIKLFSVVTGMVVILIGLYLMGFYSLPVSFEEYFQDAVRKHAGTVGGLFALGVFFSFVKVPCTFPMLLVLLERTITQGTLETLFLLLVFCAGVLTPFVGVGFLGGYTLTKRVREYRGQVKFVSGIVLILLGLWMVVR
jgi:cytochrome c biogenesis protein CcdA/glutaredoxin-related protein